MSRLYKAEFISGPDEAYEWFLAAAVPEYLHDDAVDSRNESGTEVLLMPVPGWKPDGWVEHVDCMASEGHPWAGDCVEQGYRFFWPKTGRIFKTRSAAQNTVDIIERWGGKAVVMECTPDWTPVDEANRRRKQARNQVRIDKLRAKIAELEVVK